MMRRSGFGSQLRPTSNARSGLVYNVPSCREEARCPLGHTVALLRHRVASRSASRRPLIVVCI